jgi:hypothetical protein
VGLPTGAYLAYETRPRFNLLGIWAGFTTGTGLLALVLLGQVYMINWENEVRKALLKSERVNSGDYVPLAVQTPVMGRGVGGLEFVSQRLLVELEDERELLYVHTDTVPKLESAQEPELEAELSTGLEMGSTQPTLPPTAAALVASSRLNSSKSTTQSSTSRTSSSAHRQHHHIGSDDDDEIVRHTAPPHKYTSTRASESETYL